VTDPGEIPKEVTFHYIKSNLFRVIHSDGAIGGISPRGLIYINFYSERHAIPQQVFHSIVDGKTLGDEIVDRRISRDGAIREIEVGAVMDLNGAISLRDWLNDHIRTLENMKSKERTQ